MTAPLMQNGELKALKPHRVESSTVVQSSQSVRVKNQYRCAWLVQCTPIIRDYTSVFLLSVESLYLIYNVENIVVFKLQKLFL